MKKSICIVLLVIIALHRESHANISAPNGPSSFSGDLFINRSNQLRVITETISYDISSTDFSASIDVHYEIVNDGNETFSDSVFFVASESSPANKDMNDKQSYSVKINGLNTGYMEAKSITLENGRPYDGFKFTISIKPGERKTIDVSYRQLPGFSHETGGSSIVSLSHFMNLCSGSSVAAHRYSYQIFPIKSFGKGVDEINIRVKYPAKSDDGFATENFITNIELDETEHNGSYIVAEKKFRRIPENTLEISLNVPRDNRFGLTVTPLYMYAFSGDKNSWGVSLAADYIIGYDQVSAGALWMPDDRLQLFQEMRFFPREYAYYTKACIDYRLGLGLVEKVKPEFDLGLKFIAGIRMFLTLEVTWQIFPPWFTGNWEHDIMLSAPLSF